MARSSWRIAQLGSQDHAGFLDLWVRRRVEGGVSPDIARRAAREGRLATVLGDDAVVVLLAFAGHAPVGFVMASVAPASLFTEQLAMTVEDVYVDPGHRRRGVSVALLRALAHRAERSGIAHVGVSVDASDRSAHRTLARLGFVPTITRRVSPTAGLLRRLDDVARGQRALLHRRRVLQARRGETGRIAAGGRV